MFSRSFGNLGDRWAWFASFHRGIPNLFGPVTMVFRPDLFLGLNDLIVVTRTTPSYENAWRDHAITNERLQQAFQAQSRTFANELEYAEFSTSNRFLSFAFLDSIIVEPITIGKFPLQYWVTKILANCGLAARVVERHYSDDSRKIILQEIANRALANSRGTEHEPQSEEYTEWYTTLESDCTTAINMFIERLQEGTCDIIARHDPSLKT